MKKLMPIFAFLLIALLVLGSTALADDEIKIILDNEELEVDVAPILENGRTLLPMRAIFEALGCDVQWIEDKQEVLAEMWPKLDKNNLLSSQRARRISLIVNKPLATIYDLTLQVIDKFPGLAPYLEKIANSSFVQDLSSLIPFQIIPLDVAPKIVNGRTLVPLRFIAETLGCKVDWDSQSQTVTIENPEPVEVELDEDGLETDDPEEETPEEANPDNEIRE
ncbi:MAG: copper amine oxidase N-terminal domain-containing protein [Clostridiales bacterium]|nr:copper amine oxidase N-terminal domain-containing protein [Clostridiales bacterium]